MPETQDSAANETAAAVAPDPQPQPDDQPDWQGRFTGQQKVNRDLERKLKAANTELEQLRQGRDAAPDVDALRSQLEADVAARMGRLVLSAEVRAAAAGKLSDPADALAMLDLSKLEVGSDGTIDQEKVSAAIAGLLEAKPYLAAQGGTTVRGSADGGTRNGSRPTQLTREQLKQMDPNQIEQARTEGRCDDLLGIKR